MITELGAIVAGLKGAFDTAGAFMTLKSEAERNQAVLTIQQTVLSAQRALRDLEDENSRLRRQIEETDQWRQESVRYELVQIAEGSFVRSLRAEAAQGEPHHSICPRCFEERTKSILQRKNHSSRAVTLTCTRCDSAFVAQYGSPPPPSPQRRRWIV